MTGYTSDGRPVRCTVNVLPGDRHVILYERTKPGTDQGTAYLDHAEQQAEHHEAASTAGDNEPR